MHEAGPEAAAVLELGLVETHLNHAMMRVKEAGMSNQKCPNVIGDLPWRDVVKGVVDSMMHAARAHARLQADALDEAWPEWSSSGIPELSQCLDVAVPGHKEAKSGAFVPAKKFYEDAKLTLSKIASARGPKAMISAMLSKGEFEEDMNRTRAQASKEADALDETWRACSSSGIPELNWCLDGTVADNGGALVSVRSVYEDAKAALDAIASARSADDMIEALYLRLSFMARHRPPSRCEVVSLPRVAELCMRALA